MATQPHSPLVAKHLFFSLDEDKFANVGKCKSTGREITLCYNAFGDVRKPCVLLIQGIGTSMLGYSKDFCDLLVARGLYVIRFDNRDTGRSTRFDDRSPPSFVRWIVPEWASVGERQVYNVHDLARDAIGLLDALQIDQAHLFGVSMGGMIAQLVTILAPERVASLNVLMTDAGRGDAVWPSLASYVRFLSKPRSDSIEDRAAHMLAFISYLSQGQYREELSVEELTEYFRATYERDGDNNERGMPRQVGAIMREPGRLKALKKVHCPTLVMHGMLDPLIPYVNGANIAAAVPNSKLVLFPRLGHDFPPALYTDFVEEIYLNIARTAPY